MGRNPKSESRSPLRAAILTIASLVATGCGERADRFVPPEQAAQQTLETALKAWQGGKTPPCLVEEGSPAIQLVDTHHEPGQRLVAFTVLGPTTGDAQRCYAVRLTFDNPRAEVRARFVVLGLDPLWVLRYEDYEMISHWDHPMPDKLPAAKKSP